MLPLHQWGPNVQLRITNQQELQANDTESQNTGQRHKSVKAMHEHPHWRSKDSERGNSDGNLGL